MCTLLVEYGFVGKECNSLNDPSSHSSIHCLREEVIYKHRVSADCNFKSCNHYSPICMEQRSAW